MLVRFPPAFSQQSEPTAAADNISAHHHITDGIQSDFGDWAINKRAAFN